ncbi:MAG: hypothetical protein GY861_03770 [bacterium]|nr:hypothetical protein [bacterium]
MIRLKEITGDSYYSCLEQLNEDATIEVVNIESGSFSKEPYSIGFYMKVWYKAIPSGCISIRGSE